MRETFCNSAVDCTYESTQNSGSQFTDIAVSDGEPLIVYVDVDDTIVRSVGTKRIPISRVINHIRQLHRDGAVLYCWSSGGSEYAKRSAQEFGIGDCFVGFLPKPNVILDDQPVSDWRLALQIHPMSADADGVEQYWKKIKKSRTPQSS